MSSILFFILLSLGIVRGDLQTQDYSFNKTQNSITKSRTARFYKSKTVPVTVKEFTGQGSWDDR